MKFNWYSNESKYKITAEWPWDYRSISKGSLQKANRGSYKIMKIQLNTQFQNIVNNIFILRYGVHTLWQSVKYERYYNTISISQFLKSKRITLLTNAFHKSQ